VVHWKFLTIFTAILLGLILLVGALIWAERRGLITLPPPQPGKIENSAQEVAKPPKKDHAQALEQFRAKVSSLDTAGTIVSSIRKGDSEEWVVIVVTSQWHSTPKGTRLELAKSFRNAWSSYLRENGLIEIKDRSGNKIGGSTFLGDVYVDD
jgi:hypothetical protein